MEILRYCKDLSYKNEQLIASLTKEQFNFLLLLIKDRISSLNSRVWLDHFFKNSTLAQKTQISTHYEKANKITTKKEFLIIEGELNLKNLVREVYTQFYEPIIIAGEHGYDIITRMHKVPFTIVLRSDDLDSLTPYISILKYFYDGKIYKNK
jgi:hypothetical protein